MKLPVAAQAALIATAGFFISGGSLACASEPPPDATKIEPSKISVLVLPPIDATVDSATLQPLRQQIVRLGVQYQFIARHFTVLGEPIAARAAAVPPAIDLGLAAERNPENMEALARRTGARWVVSVIVLKVDSVHPSGGTFKARSSIRLQIWDASRPGWLVNDLRMGYADTGGPPGWLFNRSLRDAAESSLAALLKAYPVVVTVSRNGLIVDYLAGQTEPLLGDPRNPFLGLNQKR